jgi:capsular polysaccharide biosynthesis protein
VRSTPERDLELDAVFGAAGFRVVEPETLPVREQIRMAAGASVLAGQGGTALHLAVFAEAGARCIEVGDTRTPQRGLRHQQVIHAVRKHRVAFVPDALPGAEIAHALDALGASGAG